MINAARLSLALALLCLGCACARHAATTGVNGATTVRLSFDEIPTGSLPIGFRTGTTQPDGSDATWEVRPESAGASGDAVIALTTPNHDSGSSYNICWSERLRFRDGTIELEVRADRGAVDQGGGPIWRAIDADNYYIARYNPLEKNFRLYIVERGKRKQLASAGDIDTPAGRWFTIYVSHAGDHIQCALDGRKLLDTHDATLTAEGGVGLWTKADAATSFDDLVVTSAAPAGGAAP